MLPRMQNVICRSCFVPALIARQKFPSRRFCSESSSHFEDVKMDQYLEYARGGDTESAFRLAVALRERALASNGSSQSPEKISDSARAATSGPEVLEEIEAEKKAARMRRKERIKRQREKDQGKPGGLEVVISSSAGKDSGDQTDSWEYWLRRAVKGGHMTAQVYLGNAILHYNSADDTGGTAVDIKEAESLYRLASSQGSADAMFNLGTLYFSGAFDTKGSLVIAADPQRSLEFFSEAAQRGDAGAQYWLGHCHISGEGGVPTGERSVEMGLQLMRQAASQKHPAALYYLCTAYRSGLEDNGQQIIEPNNEQFRSFLSEAVLAGDADALFCTADLHMNGAEGVKYNEETAVEYLERASALGHTDALTTLGAMHYGGRGGLTMDKRRAFELYSQAADLGSREAWLNLASMHYNGDGVPKSEALAREILSYLQREDRK